MSSQKVNRPKKILIGVLSGCALGLLGYQWVDRSTNEKPMQVEAKLPVIQNEIKVISENENVVKELKVVEKSSDSLEARLAATKTELDQIKELAHEIKDLDARYESQELTTTEYTAKRTYLVEKMDERATTLIEGPNATLKVE